MSTTTIDRFDKALEQYISYNLYLERRQGNGYYNLGYQIFAPMDHVSDGLLPIKLVHVEFELLLIFSNFDSRRFAFKYLSVQLDDQLRGQGFLRDTGGFLFQFE